MKTMWILGSLLFVLAIGCVQVAESSYEARKLMSQIQTIKSERDAMRLEWSQLVLEESTLTDESIVYRFAENNLGMKLPTTQKVVYSLQ